MCLHSFNLRSLTTGSSFVVINSRVDPVLEGLQLKHNSLSICLFTHIYNPTHGNSQSLRQQPLAHMDPLVIGSPESACEAACELADVMWRVR